MVLITCERILNNILILILIELVAYNAGAGISTDIFRKHKNERFSGNVVYSGIASSELTCTILCKNSQDVTCKGINYRENDRVCELLLQTTGILTDQSGWNRTPISEPTCEEGWLTFNNKCYQPQMSSRSWDVAKTGCESLGGTLASMQTKDIFDYLRGAIAGGSRYWIGGRDYEGAGTIFHWMDNSVVGGEYNGWYPGEPNGSGGQCVEFKYRNDAYSFNDQSCTVSYRYICEKDPS